MSLRLTRASFAAALVVLVLLAIQASAFGPRPAAAAALVVNTLVDVAPTDDTECTLREAIANANANIVLYDECGPAAGPTVDTITFSVSDTIVLTQGELLITDSNLTTIDGGGTITIDASSASRVLRIEGIINPAAATLSGLTITGGSVTNDAGGGIINGPGGSLTLLDSTVTGNETVRAGGPSEGGGIANFGTLTLVNSTVSGNSADDAGGGIYIGADRTATLINSTVTGNSALEGGGIGINSNATVTLTNTIVADHLDGGDCFVNVFFATITSNGNNLDSDGTCLDGTNLTDIPFGNADLGPLQDNGGGTATHALGPDSEAIDAGNDTVCAAPPPAGAGGEDQRGEPRPADGDEDGTAVCDIGAFELQEDEIVDEEPVPPVPPVLPEELPDLVVTKSCPNGAGDGDAGFNVLVTTELGAAVASDALDCGEPMVVADLEPGTYRIQEFITGPNANDFLTAIVCATADGQDVTPGTLAEVEVEADTECDVINVFDPPADTTDPDGPQTPAAPPVVIVPIDLDNANTNALNNENLNDNNNENTNTQEQSNDQEQTNDNNQTTSVSSSPSVVIDFDD